MKFLKQRSGLTRACAVVAILGLGPAPASAAFAQGKPDARHDNEQVRPFLVRHCLGCHGPVKPKGDFRLDRLSEDFAGKTSREQWLAVLEKIKTGAMPPKSKPRPPENEVRALSAWISRRVEAADAARRAGQGRVVLRRLNRTEYENTVRDLLGVDGDFKELLALDSSMDGFDNVGAALHVSSFAMERYLEAADTALTLAIANRPRPPVIKKRYSLKDQHQVKHAGESVFRTLDDTVVLFSSSAWQEVGLSQFYPSDRGHYRFRISASGYQSSGKPVAYRVLSGGGGMVGKRHLVSYFDAPADKPAVIDFVDRMEARTTISILPYGLAPAQAVNKVGADKYEGAGLAVQWVEVEGPLFDTWPPASHRGIFGDLAQAPVAKNRNRLEVVSKTPLADAERILRAFVRRAYRRTVTDADLKPFVALFKAKLAANSSFEQALRVALEGVLVSPDFLFLREKVGAALHVCCTCSTRAGAARKSPARLAGPTTLDDFALASRLSYFLWSSMPDEELLRLAEQRKLSDPATLRRQVERLLKHPRAKAFTENFVGQWLGLRDIDSTEPGYLLYPEFDHMLKVSMVRETELFFREVLDNDLSLTNLVASDFSMLNGRLAKHYAIPGVDGFAFRKVALPRDSHRGGVLTMASVLKVTANGTTTSPVTRGVWVLERILGTPPPRPPADVPAIEPDVRGATTIRQQLAKHREIASCATCHATIDPPGFALESFDVIGGWRENYRTRGRGEAVTVDGRRMPYLKGQKVDPSGVLPDGRKFRDIDEFKQLLLEDKDQLARALTEKLLTYATGAAPQKVDQPAIDAIIRKIRDKKYGLRALVHEIVQSKLFQNK